MKKSIFPIASGYPFKKRCKKQKKLLTKRPKTIIICIVAFYVNYLEVGSL